MKPVIIFNPLNMASSSLKPPNNRRHSASCLLYRVFWISVAIFFYEWMKVIQIIYVWKWLKQVFDQLFEQYRIDHWWSESAKWYLTLSSKLIINLKILLSFTAIFVSSNQSNSQPIKRFHKKIFGFQPIKKHPVCLRVFNPLSTHLVMKREKS